ncbi:MAG: GAF domain-containing protein, partial [Oscillospiraceae bacterium]|nr:GAF domain-containing protein [Oscillospiraceae bacterium]
MIGQAELLQLVQTGVRLTTEKDPNRLLETILARAMELTHCDAGTLYLYEEGRLRFLVMKTLSLGISRGENGEPIDLPPVELEEENVCAYAALHRETVNIADVYENSLFDFQGPRRYDAITGYRTQSMLAVPMLNIQGHLIGVL